MKLTEKQLNLLDEATDKLLDLILIESEYHKFFKGMLKKYGVKSPSQLDSEKRKKFFEDIKKGWKESKKK